MRTINLLDKNSNVAILLAGIIALIIGVGVARFVFTSLLPPMLENYLTISLYKSVYSVDSKCYMINSVFEIEKLTPTSFSILAVLAGFHF